MGIFHCYVSLPEGIPLFRFNLHSLKLTARLWKFAIPKRKFHLAPIFKWFMSCHLSFQRTGMAMDLWHSDFCFMACDRCCYILLVALQDFSVLYKELEAQKWPSQGGHGGWGWKMIRWLFMWMCPKIVGFPPKSSIFNRVFHSKPSILGYPYFWKHPCQEGIDI